MSHDQSSRKPGDAAARVLAAGGEAGAIARAVDWSATPLGPVADWSQALRSAAALVLHNDSGMLLWWGPDFVQIYNDAYRPVLGDKHPRAMGQPFRECWSEVFHILGPLAERPFRGGPSMTSDDLPLLINRKVHREETHFHLAYSPVPDETAQPTGIGGVLATVTEITEQAYGARQLRTLRELGTRAAAEGQTTEQACQVVAATLAENAWDVPFALVYLLEDDGHTARLAASARFDEQALLLQTGTPLDLDAEPGAPRWQWPLAEAIRARRIVTVDDLSSCPFELPESPRSDRPRGAIILPLASPEQPRAYGALVCGVSPHRVLDVGYRAFFELLRRAGRDGAAERARARGGAPAGRGAGRDRSRQDRVLLQRQPRVPHAAHADARAAARTRSPSPERGAWRGDNLNVVHRNTLRLLKLVNALLDFSRIEAGRVQASFQPTDLAAFTARSGQRLPLRDRARGPRVRGRLSAAPRARLRRPGHVGEDRAQPALERLQVHASGHASAVTQRLADRDVVLEIADTGVGIPEAELPRMFERFHRIAGARRAAPTRAPASGWRWCTSSSRLHGGRVDVDEPRSGEGTTFTVTLPVRAAAHLPADRARDDRRLRHVRGGREPFVERGAALAAGRRAPARSPSRAGDGPGRDGPGAAACSSPTTTPTCGTTWCGCLRPHWRVEAVDRRRRRAGRARARRGPT